MIEACDRQGCRLIVEHTRRFFHYRKRAAADDRRRRRRPDQNR